MEAFLQLVAHDLYNKTRGDFSGTAVVFPNKRASLFFNKYLAMESDSPLWSPAYMTISELLQQLSGLNLADPIRLTCELYKVFREETHSNESFDDFYFWGEMLISDFDDVDKNLVDAGRLFTNLQDLKNIMDDYGFLDREQEEAIRTFFRNFSIEKHTELKRRFVSLWNKLGNIYHHFRERLSAAGIAYEGMVYRNAIENFDISSLCYERYVFVGFNVLNKVESKFFAMLHDAKKALFYWDYDIAYIRSPHGQQLSYSHEAGEFISRNLALFPNQLSESCFNTLRTPKSVRLISSPTENAQARHMSEWMRNSEEYNSAIVLCNEALLLPVLHSIPSEVKNVNITMGFPLAQTPAYSFIKALSELQTTGYISDKGRYEYKAVSSVLKHPYTRRISLSADMLERQLRKYNRSYPLPSELQQDEFLGLVFTPQDGTVPFCRYLTEVLQYVARIYHSEGNNDDIYAQLYREALFKTYTIANRLLKLMVDKDLADISMNTLKRLLNRLLTSSNIPFHGEPAVGMQIMGVLETRNLDFRHIAILSLNEGQLPKHGGEVSFIPYNLRRAFGMTTIEHKNAVYAYYFYRLIQRAEDITLMYNSSSDGLNREEMSRFVLQFLVDYPHPIKRLCLEAEQSPQHVNAVCIEKGHKLQEMIGDYFSVDSNPRKMLSPSALNVYLDCPMMFYYRYVAKLAVSDEVSTDIGAALFGTIFHRAVELAYTDLARRGGMIDVAGIETLLKDGAHLQGYVDAAFKDKFFHIPQEERVEYNGTQLIHAYAITSYLRKLLNHDCKYAPFRLEGMEQTVSEIVKIDTPSGKFSVRIGGTIDRMDSKDGTLRVVDYKTGGTPKTAGNIEELFTPNDKRPRHIFQAFLYAAIVSQAQSLKVSPSLLYIHKAAGKDYSPVIKIRNKNKVCDVTDFSVYESEFRQCLYDLLQEICNPAVPFVQTQSRELCQYCDYRRLCKR